MKKSLSSIDRIRRGIERIQVAIVDDNADIVIQGVTSVIDCCFTSFTLTEAYDKFVKDKNYFLDSYDLLIFDATYRESNGKYCTLGLLETMITYNSRYKNLSVVMLGKDIEKNRWDEYLGEMVMRAKNLPNTIYDNKIEAIIRIIEAKGRKYNISVPRKLQQSYDIRGEICEATKSIMEDLRTLIDLLIKTENDSENMLDIIPQNEAERKVLASLQKIRTLAIGDIHDFEQTLEILMLYMCI